MLSPESPTIGPDDPVSFGGLSQRNQMLSAIADQVAPPHLFKRFPQQWPVVRVVIAQKSLMEPTLVETLNGGDLVAVSFDALQRVETGVVHRSRGGHGHQMWSETRSARCPRRDRHH